MKDTLKHRGMRKNLADIVAAKGVTDNKVLDAIKTIPRHLFLDSSFEDHAYQDKAFPIGPLIVFSNLKPGLMMCKNENGLYCNIAFSSSLEYSS